MKILRLSTLAFLALFTFVFYACKKDNAAPETPTLTSNFSVSSLATCVEDYANTRQTLFTCDDLTVTAENNGSQIIVNIVRTGTGGNDHFTRVFYAIYPANTAAPTLVSDGSTSNRKSAEITFDLPANSCDDAYTIALDIRGLGGAELPACVAALGEDDTEENVENKGKGRLLLTKDFTVRCECITEGCSMSQGFFFAKPQSVWSGSTDKVQDGKVLVGGKWYSKTEGSEIFKLSCNSAGKLGFQQVATIYLSIAKEGGLTGIPAELVGAINTIENFLSSKKKLGTSNTTLTINACDKSLTTKAVQAAAGAIGDWIDNNHCSE